MNTLEPLPFANTANLHGHPINVDFFSIVGREVYSDTRDIEDALFIQVNDPSLNRNLVKYQLSHFWDEVLQDTLALHFK